MSNNFNLSNNWTISLLLETFTTKQNHYDNWSDILEIRILLHWSAWVMWVAINKNDKKVQQKSPCHQQYLTLVLITLDKGGVKRLEKFINYLTKSDKTIYSTFN